MVQDGKGNKNGRSMSVMASVRNWVVSKDRQRQGRDHTKSDKDNQDRTNYLRMSESVAICHNGDLKRNVIKRRTVYPRCEQVCGGCQLSET